MMSNIPSQSEFYLLLSGLVEDGLTPAQFKRLGQILESDPESRVIYHDHISVHAMLFWRWHEDMPRERHMTAEVENNEAMLVAQADPSADIQCVDSRSVVPDTRVYPLAFLGDAFYSTASSLSQGWPLAYIVAAVILSVGLLVGAVMQVSQPGQVAHQSVPSPSPFAPRPTTRMEFVGRITGMVDCQWADESTAAFDGASVPLGRKYALASGLMEITYSTGAKVILQGPATYEVESASGGFLSVGKLTARVDKKEKRRTKNEELSGSNSSFLIPHSYFAVRTPTAIVTDLGTEFGVEVGKEGDTTSHVFRGSIELRATSTDKAADGAVRVLYANESARVENKADQDGGNRTIVLVSPAEAGEFVRIVPPARTRASDGYADLVLSLQPVAYYRMQRPKTNEDRLKVRDSGSNGLHGMLNLDKAFLPWYVTDRFGDALFLRGPMVQDCVIVPRFPTTSTNQLSFSAWVWAKSRAPFARIASNGARVPSSGPEKEAVWGQFRLFLSEPNGDLAARILQPDRSDAIAREGETHPLPLNCWQHVAFVVDGDTLRLYRNGHEMARSPCSGIACDEAETYLGIGCTTDRAVGAEPHPMFTWHGQLAEVALFHHALTAEQVRRLYDEAGLVSPKDTQTPSRQEPGPPAR